MSWARLNKNALLGGVTVASATVVGLALHICVEPIGRVPRSGGASNSGIDESSRRGGVGLRSQSNPVSPATPGRLSGFSQDVQGDGEEPHVHEQAPVEVINDAEADTNEILAGLQDRGVDLSNERQRELEVQLESLQQARALIERSRETGGGTGTGTGTGTELDAL